MTAHPKYPDDLVTLTTKPTEFEANILVADLREARIEAIAFGTNAAMLELSQRITPAYVQVRQADLERAREALKQNVADSVDLDWDEVDVGQREDDLPLNTPGRMPLIVKVGFVVAIIAILLALAGVLKLLP